METVKGYIEHIIFRNASNGYTVCNVVCDEEDITCVGFFQAIDEGENVELHGDYVEHSLYGQQLKVTSYKITTADDVVSMERYLGSGAIKGVGPALASRIVKKFKTDTFRVIEEEPERLVEVKGISERIAQEIALQMEEKKEMREAMIFLQGYNISNTLSVRIYQKYGIKIYQILKENPYQLAEDISGIGFKLADEIAELVGIHVDSDYRIRSGLLYTMTQASAEGHTYLPILNLLDRTAELLNLKAEQIEPQIMNLAMEKKLMIRMEGDEEHVYTATSFYAELGCARMLADLNLSVEGEDLGAFEENGIYRKKIAELEKQENIELDELQRTAVLSCIKNGVMILSGGPGTGKTTTINTIIHFFEQEQMDIMLAAPTGRAAKRMTEATGYEAKTIHRLLELNGAAETEKVTFEKNEENPLETDVLIIDEMSMVDVFLFQALLRAVTPGTRLILVGDVNQLPSVGPGQVLRDLIGSERFPVVILQKIFRQAGESDIVVNAHRIHKGELIRLDNKSKDFFFLERNDVQVIYKHMVQLITQKLPGYVKSTPYDIQVLTPMRKGNLGVETLNTILQKYMNKPDKEKKECTFGSRLFREGDKVMQIKNNYQLEWEIVSSYGIPVDKGQGVFNGDTGRILQIEEHAQNILVEFEEGRRVRYPYSLQDELELAYAVTIHKSQGSEYPAVIMPLLSGPKMLMNRNLLYTGVTRAKGCVTILGSSKVIEEMIKNQNEQKRFSGLRNRILEVMNV